MMAQHYKIYSVLLVVIFLSSNVCFAQFTLDDDTQEFFVIQDGDISGVGAGTDILGGTETGILDGTGGDFSALMGLLPLLLLAPLLFAATTSTATTAQAVQAPVAAAAAAPVTPQTITVLVPAATTPCVSETCPAGFMVLQNQASSTSCYSDSGPTPVAPGAPTDRSWNAALLACASTPGAYLWRPNTEQEAAAVRNKFNFPNNVDVWTGANDLDQDMTFRFAIENGLFDFGNPPFGTAIADGAPNTDCVGLRFTSTIWEWRDQACSNTRRYICEYPRRVCP